MKRRSIVALCLVAVLAAAVTTASTLGATKKATANSITVWLQIDAQSGWPGPRRGRHISSSSPTTPERT